MVTLQSVMLVALGLFFAAFLALLLAPLYHRRAARLAIEELKQSMPMTEAEIRADKDRLRAEYAIAIHKLETKLEEDRLALAHQRVEINRRDGVISGLEGEVGRLNTILEEHENARRVLEQTIVERLPKVERRLSEAKRLLTERDQEIIELSSTAERQAAALEEARQINSKQREDLHRLNATLATRAAHNRGNYRDEALESEIALRAELEALRAKTRDQSELIKRLQGVTTQAKTGGAIIAGSDASHEGMDTTTASLTQQLEEAQQALREAQGERTSSNARRTGLQEQLDDANAKLETQGKELARLKAALTTYESADDEAKAVKESKVTLKARISSLEAENASQTEALRRLRTDIAAANDKMARQAAYYVEEMRRLGSGTRLVTGSARPAMLQATAGRAASHKPAASLMDRITAPRKDGKVLTAAEGARLAAAKPDPKVSGFIRALGGDTKPDQQADKVAVDNDNTANAVHDESLKRATEETAEAKPEAGALDQETKPSQAAPQRRPGLLERLTGTGKPSI